MRTRLTGWVLSIAAFFLVWGLLNVHPTVVALVIPLLLYLALGAVFGRPELNFEVSRTVERDRVSLADEVGVTLAIQNRGPPVEFLEVYDLVPPEVEVVEGSNYLVSGMASGESLELRYAIHPRAKGDHNLGPVFVRSRDLLGFFIEEIVIEEIGLVSATPGREDIRRVRVTTRRVRPWLGQLASRSPGLGTDFWAIRDYTPGDEMRRMNWKASARLDSLFTNEYEGERSGDFVIILDAREEATLGSFHKSTLEMGVRAAASLAEMLLEGRNRVGLIVMRSVLDWVYPSFGRRQMLRITDALIRVRPGGQWTLMHLPWILGRFFPPSSQLIVISPVIDSAALEAMMNLKARGFDVMVVSPSVIDIEASSMVADEAVDVGRSILKLEREANVALLRLFATVADWRPDQPLALALREVEGWRVSRWLR